MNDKCFPYSSSLILLVLNHIDIHYGHDMIVDIQRFLIHSSSMDQFFFVGILNYEIQIMKL